MVHKYVCVRRAAKEPSSSAHRAGFGVRWRMVAVARPFGIDVCMYVCVPAFLAVCIPVCIDVCVYVCMYVCIPVCIDVCVY